MKKNREWPKAEVVKGVKVWAWKSNGFCEGKKRRCVGTRICGFGRCLIENREDNTLVFFTLRRKEV